MAENRTERITIKVTPTMYKRLEKLADELGQTPSTLASVYLGEIVRTKEIQREAGEAAVNRMGEAVERTLGPVIAALQQAMVEQESEQQEIEK
ncbi:hypothetical protein IC617_09345 [Neiella sp. HB171785]|uniref:Uncharacterized protein n=1 Tax=Neiella litorisoli TaxID=2771431 RepID=A0A8J6QGS1_9GAMM|nr:hypothetical protein [Neiella litorisoli]MBD1389634.1 hypothetical protein [Neiella litorisoli]